LGRRRQAGEQDRRDLGAEQQHSKSEGDSVNRVVGFDGQDAGNPVADGLGGQRGRHHRGDHDADVNRERAASVPAGGRGARSGQVQRADQKGDARGDAGENPDRQVGPTAAHRQVGHHHQGQRHQDHCGRRCVEDQVSAQPDFEPC
jgi:hypothetical protein